MIREYKDSDGIRLMELIEKDRFQNVYFYVDACINGFSGESISTHIVEKSEEIHAIIYVYHGSIQLFRVKSVSANEAGEIAGFITDNKIRRVSGSADIISSVCKKLDVPYTETSGYIMACEQNEGDSSGIVSFASEEDFEEIAELIISDSHLGSGYEYDDLVEQLKTRFLYEGCENAVVRADGKIVSHFATYAVADNVAVLSGMITDNAHRGKGYGGILVRTLSEHVLKSNRIPILYCYEDEYYNWYKKLGYRTIGTSAKIDLCY